MNAPRRRMNRSPSRRNTPSPRTIEPPGHEIPVVKLETHLGVQVARSAVRARHFETEGLEAQRAADAFEEGQDLPTTSPPTMRLKDEQLVQESVPAREFEAVAQRQDRVTNRLATGLDEIDPAEGRVGQKHGERTPRPCSIKGHVIEGVEPLHQVEQEIEIVEIGDAQIEGVGRDRWGHCGIIALGRLLPDQLFENSTRVASQRRSQPRLVDSQERLSRSNAPQPVSQSK